MWSVVGNHQREGLDFQETFCPFVKPTTVRLVLSLAVSFQWVVRQLDVKNAFLHGHLTEEVYMRQPSGFIHPLLSSHVCRLHKALYGLRQDLGDIHYFLGIQVLRTRTGLFLSQEKYILDLLRQFGLHTLKSTRSPLASRISLSSTNGVLLSDPTEFRSLVGALQYLSMTRPDIAYAVHLVSQFIQTPRMPHLLVVQRIYRYLQGTSSFGISLRPSDLSLLVAYSDANWAGSKKQPTVSKSSTEAEYRAVAFTVADTLWICSLLAELGFPLVKHVRLFCDNVSASYLALNSVFHARSKHVAVDYHFVRERVSHGDLIVRYVPTHLQLANIFTKSLSSDRFEFLCSNLGVAPPHKLTGDKIHSKMGEGTFGQVLECWDRERNEMVAIKIVRGIKKYREAAMIEIEMLQQLGKHDNDGNRCVQIRNWFDYRNHICIVIMHEMHLIHTDLKPKHVLLVSPEYIKIPVYKDTMYKRVPKSSAIKVIDFGSTTYERADQSYTVSTRHYRAPEVILGMQSKHWPWMELPLRYMERWMHISGTLFTAVRNISEEGGANSRESIRAVMKLPRLQNLVMLHVDHSAGDLIHLLQGLLKYDPSQRLTGREALRHPFFKRESLRFVVLDAYAVSAIGWPRDHPNVMKAMTFLEVENPDADKNSPNGLVGLDRRFLLFNGGVGREQLDWLDTVLQDASNSEQKVIICCHIPLDPGASSDDALLWNYDEVMDVIHRYKCVKACLAGHDHKGGYSVDSYGVHHRVV
ncbi:Serine/threonine-protein kinase AFC2-like protein [Drosera capensis]